MKKLNEQLAGMIQSGQTGFMMHMVAGYPDLASSEVIARQILDSGADLLEVQIPFSDPVADGPIIARANEIALNKGTSVEDSLSMIKRIARSTAKSIVIMTYFNIIHHYGVERFCKRASKSGVQGLIVPDYPQDEEAHNSLIKFTRENDLAFIQVVSSTTPPDRLHQIVEYAGGFIYCMARTGITGRKTEISPQTVAYLQAVRASCSLPLAVGFGLSEEAQVKALKPYAEIMIVGSALIKAYADQPLETALASIEKFMLELIHP